MTTKILTLDDVKDRTVEELLRAVSTAQQSSDIMLPDGEEIVIQPKPSLKQLPVLEGYVPKGWKDAIYKYTEVTHGFIHKCGEVRTSFL